MRVHIPAVLITVTFLVVGCATPADSGTRLAWLDQWGDRGVGVLARDHAMCRELVETRRSLLTGCMQQRGWRLDPLQK
jgi:hypothetical protein